MTFESKNKNWWFLHNALSGSITSLKDSLYDGANINAVDNKGRNALMRSMLSTDTHPKIDFLLQHNIDINAKDKYGKDIFHFWTEKEFDHMNAHKFKQITDYLKSKIEEINKKKEELRQIEIARPYFKQIGIVKKQSGSGTIKKLCKKCNINYHKSDKQKYKELSRYFKKLSLEL
jgi:ankyrin repeat protein